jgi:hypothetical protein
LSEGGKVKLKVEKKEQERGKRNQEKKKRKVVPIHAMKASRGSRH